jgi:hypothetical protein
MRSWVSYRLAALRQLGVSHLSFEQKGHVRIRVFPKFEEILIRGGALGRIARRRRVPLEDGTARRWVR